MNSLPIICVLVVESYYWELVLETTASASTAPSLAINAKLRMPDI